MNPNLDPNMTFTVPISAKDKVDIKIYVSRLRAQGLDLTPWASTSVLSNQLHKLDIPLPADDSPNVALLELGAGIGLVGLTATMVWKRPVILTDLEGVVAGLTHNVRLNDNLLRRHGGTAIAASLDWAVPSSLTPHEATAVPSQTKKADVILAADVIYDENHPGMLANTVLRWLAPGPTSRFILTLPLRVAYLDQIRELWRLLEDGGLETVAEGKEEAEGDDWDDEKLCEWSVWKWKSEPLGPSSIN